MSRVRRPILYAPIERHGIVGDRRTAALIAADGTLDWLCLPHYRGEMLFGALLDAEKGGYFRFGPAQRVYGSQAYAGDTPLLNTHYRLGATELLAQDFMVLPEGDHTLGERVLVRRLRARGGPATCVADYAPSRQPTELALFRTHPLQEFRLAPGEEAWAVLSYGADRAWNVERARAAHEDTMRRWQRWADGIAHEGPYRSELVRSLLTIKLLGYAPTGALVAAPTTSLPERIGGSWNADYRLAWVRDSSLSLQALAQHGDREAARHYFDWLVGLEASGGQRLQVLYDIQGDTSPAQRDCPDLTGYRNSGPVHDGNHAYKQKQLGSSAYLADCAYTYFCEKSPWKPAYFELVAREADYLAAHWDSPDNGIWELSPLKNRVNSRVASWVTLARASELARLLEQSERARTWREQLAPIRNQVLERGYSQQRGAFRQDYDNDALDASALLIPILGFLPGDDPRVISTVDCIARDLTINGHVHRFDPAETEGAGPEPLGEYEGSFVLCTCWLASAYALGGRIEPAQETLERVRLAAGSLGLLAEGIDARSGAFLGNYPLLFAHAEFIRAVLALTAALQREPQRTK